MKHKQLILFFDLQASSLVGNKYSLNQTLQKRGAKTRLQVSALTLRTNDDQYVSLTVRNMVARHGIEETRV